jgi:hypothetical protein
MQQRILIGINTQVGKTMLIVYFNFSELNMQRRIALLKLQFTAHAHRI